MFPTTLSLQGWKYGDYDSSNISVILGFQYQMPSKLNNKNVYLRVEIKAPWEGPSEGCPF